MARPNLDDPEALKAYRKELRGIGRPLSIAGLGLILVGILLTGARLYGWFAYNPASPDLTALGAFTGGWTLMVWAFVKRNLYHRSRMAEPQDPDSEMPEPQS